MPRDVTFGEGYDGDVQLASHAPGHHNGEYWLDSGASTLMHVGDIPDQGNGIGGGMGDVAAEWAQLLARDSLDKLASSLGKVVSQLIGMGAYRKEVINGYLTAKAYQNQAVSMVGSLTINLPFGMSMPNPSVIPAMKAFQTAVQAVRFFARLEHQTEQLNIVFKAIEGQLFARGLKTDADMVNTSLYQVNRFILETGNMFIGPNPQSPIVPEYMKAMQELVGATTAERRALGVDLSNYLDPRWYEAYMKGADKVIPLPKAVVSGVGGMGSLADAIHGMAFGPLAIIAIAVGIAIIVASIIATLKLLPDNNLLAKQSLELLKKAQDRKAAIEADGRAKGWTQEQIDTAKASVDKDTGKDIEKMPPPTSLLSGLVGPLGIAAAAIVAAVVLNK